MYNIVYILTCDLHDPEAVFGAGLYCHKNCIRSYIYKNMTNLTIKKNESKIQASDKMTAFNELLEVIDPPIKNAKSFTLSDPNSVTNC